MPKIIDAKSGQVKTGRSGRLSAAAPFEKAKKAAAACARTKPADRALFEKFSALAGPFCCNSLWLFPNKTTPPGAAFCCWHAQGGVLSAACFLRAGFLCRGAGGHCPPAAKRRTAGLDGRSDDGGAGGRRGWGGLRPARPRHHSACRTGTGRSSGERNRSGG